jgi:Ca2+-binding RTX toxin-like protein
MGALQGTGRASSATGYHTQGGGRFFVYAEGERRHHLAREKWVEQQIWVRKSNERKTMMRRGRRVLVATLAALVLASGVALAVTKIGTNGPDTLRGTNGPDNLIGKGGNDVLYALAGKDNLLGGEGKDWLLTGERRALGGNKNSAGGPGNDGVTGGLGSDDVLGGPGNDFVFGDRGSDNVLGGEGTDYVVDGPFNEASKDRVLGGDGNDVLDVINGPPARDIVSCGDGFDRVLADRKDVVAPDCEKVAVGFAAVEELFISLSRPGGFFDNLFGGLAPFPGG